MVRSTQRSSTQLLRHSNTRIKRAGSSALSITCSLPRMIISMIIFLWSKDIWNRWNSSKMVSWIQTLDIQALITHLTTLVLDIKYSWSFLLLEDNKLSWLSLKCHRSSLPKREFHGQLKKAATAFMFIMITKKILSIRNKVLDNGGQRNSLLLCMWPM